MIKKRERKFNTAGPGQIDINYVYDPLKRIDLEEIEDLISNRRYFVLHAPRQSGKTSCLLALRDYLNEQGEYWAVYCNVEAGQAFRNDVNAVEGVILEQMAMRVGELFEDQTNGKLLGQEIRKTSIQGAWITDYLSALSERLDRPVVFFIDEIDALVGDSLVNILRQIRAGYDKRPQKFPISIILCGVRDVRDYRIHTSNGEIITGGSAFNIKAESLKVGNFTMEEIKELYQMHTDETGQEFEPECFDKVWTATEGQPWLVNALANEVTWRMRENRDRTVRITAEMMYKAQESIIYRRETHIDALIDKLREERVRRVIQPMLAGSDDADDSLMPTDDILYAIDLGLITEGKPRRISNAIYREVIPRELTWTTQSGLSAQPVWYMNPDNSINMNKLMTDFQQFFRKNADSWIQKFDYHEAGPQLLLQAYLQRVVNGGGYIDREYGLGRKRTDLLIRKPLTDGYGGPIQYIVLELKIKRGDLEKTILKGLEQTAWYMDSVEIPSLREGHFIVFNRDKGAEWDDKIFHETRVYKGRTIEVWGM